MLVWSFPTPPTHRYYNKIQTLPTATKEYLADADADVKNSINQIIR